MRRAVVVALVVLVLVTGLPVFMGMDGMAFCAECGPGLLGPMICLVALAAAGFAVPRLLSRRAGFTRYRALRSRLLSHLLERPPQLVTA